MQTRYSKWIVSGSHPFFSILLLLTVEVLFGAALGQAFAAGPADKDTPFPKNPWIVDVTAAPYHAKGDGVADDTAALQQALSDTMGQHKIVYLPKGTYLVSKTLTYSKKNSAGADAWGFTWIQGQSRAESVIRLKDGAFTDPARPQAVIWGGGFGSADWFHNYVENVTVNTGRGNAGAVGLQFYSNNSGAVRNVTIVSEDGAGVAGLDLAHRDMNGPLLVRNLTVKGFATGVLAGHVVNSQTFEFLTLLGQTKAGFINGGQCVAVRGLSYEGPATAITNNGLMALLEAKLIGRGTENAAAVVNSGRLFARDVATRGYRRAIEGKGEIAAPEAADVKEYCSHRTTSPFASPPGSLRLPVKETPEVPWDDPATWAVVDTFGADPNADRDSSAGIQKAIDSGATTVFFPGNYILKTPVRVRGKVRRLLGVGAWIDYLGKCKPDLIIEDGDAPTVVIEHFQAIHGGMEINTSRAVVLRSVQGDITCQSKGDLFLEDICTNGLVLQSGQNVWARQLNIELPDGGTHLTNPGAVLWVLGYKTERGGTLVHTSGGGKTELFGTFSYTTTKGRAAPMFVNDESSVFAFFGEVCFSGDPFRTLVRETRGGVTKEVLAGRGSVAPYSGYGAK